MATSGIVLSAGKGTRMKSALPKALHRMAGRPLCHYPVQAALDAGCHEVVVVVGHGKEQVSASLEAAFGARVRIAVQTEQLGTGDAARAALASIDPSSERLLILNGDAPLVSAEHLRALLEAGQGALLALATCVLDDPTGYGRILRNAAGAVTAIREHKDLRSDDEAHVREINPGLYLGDAAFFRRALPALSADNAQKEYYLTDVVQMAVAESAAVLGVPLASDVMEGVNDRDQLVRAETKMYAAIARRHRIAGVTVREGALIESTVEIEAEAEIGAGAVLRGNTRIGAHAFVDVGCVLTDVSVAAAARLKPYTVAEDARIGAKAQVGPFSHLRPGSELGEDVHVGNFVETKKTRLGKGSKANHLAYLGDGQVGERVNVGAGVIFCNYDGVRKHVTTLEDDVFVGSDSQLVAPVTIGRGAYVGTGTTVTRDVPAGDLAIGRAKQENKTGYADRLRARFKSEAGSAAGGAETSKNEGK